MICAVIDIGSNSVLLTLSDESGNVVLDLDEVTKLGEGLSVAPFLRLEAIKRTVDTVCEFYKLARERGATKVIAVGTMALRIAKNNKEFLKEVKNQCGLEIKILSGEEEARLSYEAAVTSLVSPGQSVAVFDVGGKSTEIIIGKGKTPQYLKSIDIGALTLLETSNIDFKKSINEIQLKKLKWRAEHILSPLIPKVRVAKAIGIGGTVTNLAAIKLGLTEYDGNKVHGLKIHYIEIVNILKILSSQPVELRRMVAGLQPERAELIIPGLSIVLAILNILGKDELTISDRGLRHALLKKCHERAPSK